MLPNLYQEGLVVPLVLAVVVTMVVTVTLGMLTMVVQLARFLEIVALTGGTEESDGGEQQGKAFHCGVL